MVIIASAGVGSDGERLSAGVWTPSDIAWVPVERRPAAPLVLTDAEATCSSRRSAAALAATTEAVDLYGADADNDGAHPLEKP